jgi:hypothetical protein
MVTHPSGGCSEQIVTRFGPLEVDWPRSIGHFGGVTVAVAGPWSHCPSAHSSRRPPLFG